MFTRCRLDATAHGSHPATASPTAFPSLPARSAVSPQGKGSRLRPRRPTGADAGKGFGCPMSERATAHARPRPQGGSTVAATVAARLPSMRQPSRPRSRRLPRRRPRHAARLRITPATSRRVFPILDFPRWEHFAAPARRAAPCLDGATGPAVPPGRAAPGRGTDHAPRARTCRTWKRCRRSRRLTPRRLTPRCVPTAPGARRPRPRPGHVLDGHGSTPGPARRAARKRHALDDQRARAQ